MNTVEFPPASNFKHYLRKSGWAEVEPSDASVWQRSLKDEVYQVVIPNSAETYATLAHEALRTIAYVEQRPYEDVANDILLRGADTLALRYTPDLPPGQATLPLVHDALTSLRELLTSSAKALTDPSAVLGRSSGQVKNFSDQIRIGTEAGSFIIHATIPLANDASETSAYDEEVPVTSSTYSRRVTRRVIRSLETAQVLAAKAAKDHSLEVFGDSASTAPVSANELEAFSGLGGSEFDPFTLRFSVSPMDSDRGEKRGIIRVSSEEQRIFKEASDHLRKLTSEEPEILTGRVLKLTRNTLFGPGKIVLRASSKETGMTRNVTIELADEDYRSAGEAHLARETVSIKGTLVRKARSWELRDVSDFQRKSSDS